MCQESSILSLQERCNKVLARAFSIAYEDNPSRTEWPQHTINADFMVSCPEDRKGSAYYMIELYLPELIADKLIALTEFLPAWLDTYLSGRCSLHDMLHVYTPEKLESIVQEKEQLLLEVEQLRNQFIVKQQHYA